MHSHAKLRGILRWGVAPALLQLCLLGAMIVLFVLTNVSSWAPRLAWVPDRLEGGEAINDPNVVRFCYALLTIPLTAGLLALSRRCSGKTGAFWLALLAGITAWQGLGESSWHFGVPSGSDFLFFPKIEGVQGTTFLVLFLPIALRVILNRRSAFSFRAFLTSFTCNWLGHWLLLGIGGLTEALGILPMETWLPICGWLLGGGGCLLALWQMSRRAPDQKSLLLLSIALYMSLGVLAEGCMGIASSIE